MLSNSLSEPLKKKYHRLKSIFRILKVPYWWILNLGYRTKLLDIYDVPVIINNFNRLTFPVQLIEFLKKIRLYFLDYRV